MFEVRHARSQPNFEAGCFAVHFSVSQSFLQTTEQDIKKWNEYVILFQSKAFTEFADIRRSGLKLAYEIVADTLLKVLPLFRC